MNTQPRTFGGGGPARRPRIGISCYAEAASWSYWQEVPAAIVPLAYVESVRIAGGLPYLIAPIPEIVEDAHHVIDTLDGLVVVGGSDIDPALYAAAVDPASGGFHGLRDRVEAALISAAIEADLPYLGVCRGLQLLNVIRGGTLVQHLPNRVADPLRHRPGLGQYGRHQVTITAGSQLGDLLGSSSEVITCHHQAPDRVGDGLVLVARDSADQTIEALEDPACTFCLGVQWHPEEDQHGSGQTLFRGLVEQAQRRHHCRNERTLTWR